MGVLSRRWVKPWLCLWAVVGCAACQDPAGPLPPFSPPSEVGDTNAASSGATPHPDGGSTLCPPSDEGCPCAHGLCGPGLRCDGEVCVYDEDADGTMTTGPSATTEPEGETESESDTEAALDTDGAEATSTGLFEETDGPDETGAEDTGVVDPCSAAPAGAGHYCGEGIGGDPGVLYECSADGETVVRHLGPGCPSCVQCPVGFADYCDGGFTPPFSCIDGI